MATERLTACGKHIRRSLISSSTLLSNNPDKVTCLVCQRSFAVRGYHHPGRKL